MLDRGMLKGFWNMYGFGFYMYFMYNDKGECVWVKYYFCI